MTARWRLRLLLGGLLLAGLALKVLPWHDLHLPSGAEFLPEWIIASLEGLGEALAIAALLGLSVDELAKRHLLEDVLDDISAHIAGRLLEPKLREVIEQYLKADLVRSRWDITYRIADWPGQPAGSTFKKLTTIFDYQMENRSASEKPYDCVYDVEKSLFPEIGPAQILKVEGRAIVGAMDDNNFSYPAYPGDRRGLTETESNLIFKRPVTLWPSPLIKGAAGGERQASYEIHTESEELVSEGSILPFFAKHLVLVTTLTIEYPIDRLNVWVELSLGPDKTEEGKPLADGKGKSWEFDPLLPGQGFTVRFRSKVAAAGQTAPAVVSVREVQA